MAISNVNKISNTEANSSKHVLVLFAHPSLDLSEVNRLLAEAACTVDGVTLVDLYAEYPEFQIDIDKEQQRLREHDVIIFLHPLYWYSTPAILKEWQDLVLEHGFAYGANGTALNGKTLFSALTAGGTEDAYCNEGFNNFTIRELLRPIEQMSLLCGMTYLPPFVLFGSRTAEEEGRVAEHLKDWVRLLEALRDNRLNTAETQNLTKLNNDLDTLLEEA